MCALKNDGMLSTNLVDFLIQKGAASQLAARQSENGTPCIFVGGIGTKCFIEKSMALSQ